MVTPYQCLLYGNISREAHLFFNLLMRLMTHPYKRAVVEMPTERDYLSRLAF